MKKGVTKLFVEITLALVLFVFLISLVARTIPLLNAESSDGLCLRTLSFMDASRHYSLKQRLLLKEKANPITSPQCPIHFTTVAYPSSRDKHQQELEIYSTLAREAKRCWKKTGQGMLDPFAAAEMLRVNHCILCAKISFDKKIQKEFPTLNRFYEYLATQKRPLSSQTYLKYLSPSSPESKAQPPLRDEFDNINTTKAYYLVSYFSKGKTFMWFWKVSSDAVGLRLIPVDRMPDSGCDYLYS